MKTMKSAVSLVLILYLCVSLSGVLLVLDASAKITPKETDHATGFYTVKKGDTLWHLAKKYRNDPLLWRDFEEYNIFSNPHLIYPKEQLQVSAMWGFPGVAMPEPEPVEMEPDIATMAELDMLREKFDAHLMATDSALNEIGAELSEVHEEIHGLQEGLDGLKSSMDMGGESLAAANMENTNAIGELNKSVMGLSDGLNSHAMAWENQHKEHAAHIDGHLDGIQETLAGMKAVQDETAGKVEKILNPPKMKAKKRPIAFLTALVGGAAWVAMNALGDRE